MSNRPYTCASIEAESKGKYETLPPAHQEWVQHAHAAAAAEAAGEDIPELSENEHDRSNEH